MPLSFIKDLFANSEPMPYTSEFFSSLNENQYPQHLKKLYKYIMKKNLNLKNPKTFTEKIQWLKLYDTLPIKTQLTDKVLAHNWVKDKIGERYLKPILWIGDSFDCIPFDELPQNFVIKANNGCMWHFVIKNKDKFLSNNGLYEIVKRRFGWYMSVDFCTQNAQFELQYKNIKPQILIEPLFRDNIDEQSIEYVVYCFNGRARLIQKIKYTEPRQICCYDENLKFWDINFFHNYSIINQESDDNLRLAVELSKQLASGFKFVRIDWSLYQNNAYFNDMLFTPLSGFYDFVDKNLDIELGKMLNLKD